MASTVRSFLLLIVFTCFYPPSTNESVFCIARFFDVWLGLGSSHQAPHLQNCDRFKPSHYLLEPPPMVFSVPVLPCSVSF